MRYFVLVVTTFMTINSSIGQINEIGVFVGGSNYIGDIGPTDYIAPNNISLGVLYKWNKHKRYSFRGSFMYGKITADDQDASSMARKERGLSFENEVKELSVGFEFNFFDFDLHKYGTHVTPYLYTGVTYFWYEALYFSDGQALKFDTDQTFALPMVAGIKANVTSRWVVALEIGARLTFTDGLDGSNPVKGLKDDPTLKFGNVNSDDWYVFTGITLTYTFGCKPCHERN